MTKNLKVYKYRGCPVYIRFLGTREYETLIVFRNQIHVYQIHVDKKQPNEKRATVQQLHDGVMGELMNVSALMIDNFKAEWTFRKVVKTTLNQFYVKITKIIGNTRESIGIPRGWESIAGFFTGRQEPTEDRSNTTSRDLHK